MGLVSAALSKYPASRNNMKLVMKMALLPVCLVNCLYSMKFKQIQPAINPKPKTKESAGKMRLIRLA